MKKILLYSQNDKNLEGFKELARALETLQATRSGRTAGRAHRIGSGVESLQKGFSLVKLKECGSSLFRTRCGGEFVFSTCSDLPAAHPFSDGSSELLSGLIRGAALCADLLRSQVISSSQPAVQNQSNPDVWSRPSLSIEPGQN